MVWSELEAMVSHPKVLNVMQIPNYNVLFQYMDNLISAMCNGEFITRDVRVGDEIPSQSVILKPQDYI